MAELPAHVILRAYLTPLPRLPEMSASDRLRCHVAVHAFWLGEYWYEAPPAQSIYTVSGVKRPPPNSIVMVGT